MAEADRLQLAIARLNLIEEALHDMELMLGILKRQRDIVANLLGEDCAGQPNQTAAKVPVKRSPLTEQEKTHILGAFEGGATPYQIAQDTKRPYMTVKGFLVREGRLTK
jgi:hypothetical protein